MIRGDQPRNIAKGVYIAVSSRSDGTMLDRTRDIHASDVVQNRQAFCQANGCAYADCVYQLIRYGDSESYQKIVEVTEDDTAKKKRGVHADALFTAATGVGLLLPVADCVATVLYDPVKKYLAMVHLGRHSTYANLATTVVEYFVSNGSCADDLVVWMSPSASKNSYRLEWFDRADDPLWQGFYKKKIDGYYLDLAGYNRQRFICAGVVPESITVSSVDTQIHPGYFSHQNGDIRERIAILAFMN